MRYKDIHGGTIELSYEEWCSYPNNHLLTKIDQVEDIPEKQIRTVKHTR